jgi:hypothetical protein
MPTGLGLDSTRAAHAVVLLGSLTTALVGALRIRGLGLIVSMSLAKWCLGLIASTERVFHPPNSFYRVWRAR